MGQIISGYFATPNTTPSGQPKKVAVNNPYLTKDEFITSEIAVALGITSSSAIYTSGRLDRLLLIASVFVNSYCRRWFDVQTIDETKEDFVVNPYNPQLLTIVLKNAPYQKINTVWIQVLKWYIQMDLSYIQDFPDYGYYKIVPLLSTSGQGLGSPIPSEIIDKVNLGVLWTNYTFGYGQNFTAQTLTRIGSTAGYQAPLYNRLWAPSQTLNVYDGGVLINNSLGDQYTVDYPNGIVTMTGHSVTGAITSDFTTNESLPSDIKEAVSMMVAYKIGLTQNPIGAKNVSMQTYSVGFSAEDDNPIMQQVKSLLDPYQLQTPVIF